MLTYRCRQCGVAYLLERIPMNDCCAVYLTTTGGIAQCGGSLAHVPAAPLTPLSEKNHE